MRVYAMITVFTISYLDRKSSDKKVGQASSQGGLLGKIAVDYITLIRRSIKKRTPTIMPKMAQTWAIKKR
jgi:hypothetical protein